jgi:hypothetical protein
MSFLDRVQTKQTDLPPRIVIHGENGCGKTTFAASAKQPIFLLCEEGRGKLQLAALPDDAMNSYSDALAAIQELVAEKHDYKTLVIDTIDAFEPLVHKQVCDAHGKKHIEDFGYGKGYYYADPLWLDLFALLDQLRRERQMWVVVLSHCTVKNVKDLQIGPYDKLMPKLHDRASAFLREWADIVGYLATDAQAVTHGDEKGRKVRTARSAGQHILHLKSTGGFAAKNRYDLPDRIELPKEKPFDVLRKAVWNSILAERKAPAEEMQNAANQ